MDAQTRLEIKQAVQEAMLEVFSFSYTKKMAAAMIGISTPTLYARINNKQIETDKDGRIPMSEILRLKRMNKKSA